MGGFATRNETACRRVVNRRYMREFIKFCLKAFWGGCFSTIGAAVVIALILSVFIFYPQNVVMKKIIELQPTQFSNPSYGLNETPINIQIIQSTQQLEDLPKMDIWMTPDVDPTGQKVDSVRNDKLTHLHVWVQSNINSSIPFTIWIIGTNVDEPFGPNFTTNITGEPMSVGQFASLMRSGTYRLEVRVGPAKVGELIFKITDN
jgi:hypothetical protein